jgi:hypothetical protein
VRSLDDCALTWRLVGFGPQVPQSSPAKLSGKCWSFFFLGQKGFLRIRNLIGGFTSAEAFVELSWGFSAASFVPLPSSECLAASGGTFITDLSSNSDDLKARKTSMGTSMKLITRLARLPANAVVNPVRGSHGPSSGSYSLGRFLSGLVAFFGSFSSL